MPAAQREEAEITAKKRIDQNRIEKMQKMLSGEIKANKDVSKDAVLLNSMRSISDLVAAEHINLALYAKNESIQLAAIKLLYQVLGIGPGASKNTQQEAPVEDKISSYMTTIACEPDETSQYDA